MIRNEGRSAPGADETGPAWSPAHLGFACLVNGFEPAPLDKPFTYLELGIDREPVVAHTFAAGAPHGRFYAAGLGTALQNADTDVAVSNLTLLEPGVAELVQGKFDLPQFDIIALRGEYDRIPVESRRHVVDFMARYLKPGGVVHVRYHAMPGGAVGHPLQHLLLEYEECHARMACGQTVQAHDFVQALAGAGAKYFESNPVVQACWDRVKEQPLHSLSRMEPLYFADVAHDFSAAKLDFAGALDPRLAFPRQYLTAQQQALLDSVADMTLRETLKDTLCNTAYRSDVFVRGARGMHPLRQKQWLERCALVLAENDQPDTASLSLSDAPAGRPFTLADMADLPAFRDKSLATLLEMAALLVGSGRAVPVFVQRNHHEKESA